MRILALLLMAGSLLAQAPKPGTFTPSGGAIGGASSVAATQVLYGTGAGVAGSEAAFTYNATNDRLFVGTAGAGAAVSIGNVSGFGGIWLGSETGTPTISNYSFLEGGGGTVVNSATGKSIDFRINNSNIGRFATTGNLLLGTTTDDGTNKLQVAGSGKLTGSIQIGSNNAVTESVSYQIRGGNDGAAPSTLSNDYFLAGTQYARSMFYGTTGSQSLYHDIPNAGMIWRTYSGFNQQMALTGTTTAIFAVRNALATTGATEVRVGADAAGNTSATTTQLIVRAGATQGSTNLQTWQNSGGSTLSAVSWAGEYTGYGSSVTTGTNGILMGAGFNLAYGTQMASDWILRWSATTNASSTKDLSLDRQAAGVLRISNTGTTGGGLIIEALKSTTGTRYVCVDTTGRFTSSASACSGT